MRSELLIQANNLMRSYLLRHQIDAVKFTFQLVPSDTLSVLSEHWESRTGLTDLPADVEAAIREYLCVKTYIDALDAFQDWFNRFHHSKPKKALLAAQQRVGASTQLNFTENLLKEQQSKQHQIELQRWHAAVESLTQSAIEKLYNVLLFPDGGWMADSVQYQEEDSPRQQQQQLLRQSCIPHAALLLCNVLTSTERYCDCLELANVLAGKLLSCCIHSFTKIKILNLYFSYFFFVLGQQQGLYLVCSAEQLAQLTKHLRQAYVKVLDLSASS